MTDHSGDGSADRELTGPRPAARSFRHALSWSFVMNGGREAVTFVVTFVIAGIVGPEVYGTVALALAFVFFVQLFLQGMVPALIQRPELSSRDTDTSFWLVMGASVVLGAVSVAFSGLWASLNNTPELEQVLMVLAVLVPIKGAVVVQEALLRRELEFRVLAFRTNISVLIGGIAGVVAAILGAGVWALVIQQILTAVVELIVLWGVSSWRPGFRFSRRSARELGSFSMASTAGGIGVFATNRSDALLTGMFFGATAVGLYRLAYRVVDSVTKLIMSSLQSVSLPELARYQHDQTQTARRVEVILRTSALLAIPVLGVVAAASAPLMRLLGEDWSDAVAPLRWLCIAGAVRAVGGFTGPMLQAVGRPRFQAALAWLSGVLSAATFVIVGLMLEGASTSEQVLWMAVSRAALFGVVFLAINAAILVRVGGLRLGTIVRAVSGSVAGALAALVVGVVLAVSGSSSWSAWVDLTVTVAATGAAAVGVVLLVDPVARKAISDLRERLRSRRRGGPTGDALAGAVGTDGTVRVATTPRPSRPGGGDE